MTYEESLLDQFGPKYTFATKIIEVLDEEYPDHSHSISVKSGYNGTKRLAIVVEVADLVPEPVIYLDSYYDMHQLGMDLEATAIVLEDDYEKTYRATEELKEEYDNFDNISDAIHFGLLNTAMNQELLEEVPHIDTVGMSLVFKAVYTDKGLEMLINNEQLSKWGISLEDLKECALTNMQDDIVFDTNTIYPLCTITSKNIVDGAAVLFAREKNMSVAEHIAVTLGTEYYVLPSSINEMILVSPSVCQDETPQSLKKTIEQINSSSVGDNEVLSNDPYLFNATMGTLKNLTTNKEFNIYSFLGVEGNTLNMEPLQSQSFLVNDIKPRKAFGIDFKEKEPALSGNKLSGPEL